ncbi:hypothetical protein OG203_28560 [Nocardia sp. NBC_01499]|uniref:hypothetical protein n=1 Tax=Nocardia sp. NBC_01499 TaxID=2903597 RepID=UPI00386667A8
MFAVRGFVVAALIGGATLVGGGAAMAAAPLPLEPSTAAPADSIANNCAGVIHPIGQLVCTISSLSG